MQVLCGTKRLSVALRHVTAAAATTAAAASRPVA